MSLTFRLFQTTSPTNKITLPESCPIPMTLIREKYQDGRLQPTTLNKFRKKSSHLETNLTTTSSLRHNQINSVTQDTESLTSPQSS